MRETLIGLTAVVLFAGAGLVVVELLSIRPDSDMASGTDLDEIDRHLDRSKCIQTVLQKEPEERWKAIPWEHDPEAAAKRAAEEHKPILTAMVVSEYGRTGAPRCCLGGRLFMSGALSDPDVIQEIRRDFVPLFINLTEQRLPSDMPALNPWSPPIGKYAEFSKAFSTSVVADASGTEFYGHSGRSYPPEYELGGRYRNDSYLAFLHESVERYKKAQAIKQDATLPEAERAKRLATYLAGIRASMQPLSTMGPVSGPGVPSENEPQSCGNDGCPKP
jgi:hypothetical protein